MQYPINKEIRYYEEEIFLGLNLRQLLCSGVAIAAAVAVYLLLDLIVGRETASWICIVAAAPLAAAGFFVYDFKGTVNNFLGYTLFSVQHNIIDKTSY